VSELKEFIEEKLRVERSTQKLVLGEDALLNEDDCRLCDCGVASGACILIGTSESISEFAVMVRRLADTEDTYITVVSSMTVSRLKVLIEQRLNVESSMQQLVWGDTLLSNDSYCLNDYGVGPGANILVVKSENPFAVGKEIEGKDSNGRWIVGTIKAYNCDDTLVLALAEGGEWPQVYKGNTRPIPEFEIGELLEGMDENGYWFPVIVRACNGDDTYACDVIQEDGSIEMHWPDSLRQNLRHIEDFSEKPDGNYYGRDCNGDVWTVKVTKNNGNGTFFCEVQDGYGTKWEEALRCNLW